MDFCRRTGAKSCAMLTSDAVGFCFNFALITSRGSKNMRVSPGSLSVEVGKSAQVVSGLGLTAAMLLQEFSPGLPWQGTELL